MNLEDMAGQWFGRSYPGDSGPASQIVVNIEARSPQAALMIAVEPINQQRMLSEATIKAENGSLTGRTFNYQVYDHRTHTVVPLSLFCQTAGIKEKLASEANFIGNFDGKKLTGTFQNNIGKTGRFELWRNFSEAIHGRRLSKTENIKPLKWEEFKKHVASFRSKGRILFRGQHSNTYPLRTSFHRKNRNNVPMYLVSDVFRLRHRINAISSHVYQQTPEDLQGLLGLAQHHGFPTPLLDWTESPYVAAFFAFDCLTEKSQWNQKPSREPVRVYTFDLDAWQRVPRTLAQSLNDPHPDFQFFHPPAHNNPRYYPQQSIAAFSNIDNIEDFITAYEYQNKATYLTKIDIIASERDVVEDELRFMGITPATLFPGLEGACKSLRAELF